MTSADEAQPISSPSSQVVEPPYSPSDIRQRGIQPPEHARVAPWREVPASRESLITRLGRARGFLGGLVAIAFAFFAQQILINSGNWEVAQRYYLLAFVILILSLIHPSLPRFRRKVVPPFVEPAVTPLPTRTKAKVVATSDATYPKSPGPASDAINWIALGNNLTSVDVHGAVVGEQSRNETTLATTPIIGRRKRLKKARNPRTFWFELRAKLGWKLTAPLLLVTAAMGVAAYLLLREKISSIPAGWLWVATMLMLLITFYGVPVWPGKVKGLLAGPEEGFFARGIPHIGPRTERIVFLIIMVGALLLRVWNLEYFPGIFGDEGERAIHARNINRGDPALMWGTGWWAVPNVYFYGVAWSLRLFGDNMVGARMLDVVAGLVTIWAIYRIGRLLWGPRVGLLAAALLAISPLWIQFARQAGESTPTVMFWALGFLFLFKALRTFNWVDWALSGMAFAFSLYFYASGKLVVPMVAAIGLYLLVRWRLEFIKRCALGFGLLLGAFWLTFMPYYIFLSADNFHQFFSRAQETSIFSPGNAQMTFARFGIPYDLSWASLSAAENIMQHPWPWAQVIWRQTQLSVDSLYRVGDTAFFYNIFDHNGSLLTPVFACLTLLGLVYFAWKVWDARYGLALIWFAAGLAGAIFTIHAPTVQRLVGAWPITLLFPAVVLDRIFASAWPLSLNLARRWATVPLVALVLFGTAEGIREYFVLFEQQCPYCGSTMQARYIQALGQNYKGYQLGVGSWSTYFSYGSTRFVAPNVEGVDLNVPMDHFPTTSNNRKGLAYIVYPNNNQYLSLINLFYPDGKRLPMYGRDGSFQFTIYEVPREQVAALQTTFAEYGDARGGVVRRNEPNLGTNRPADMPPWSPPPQLFFPMTVSWQGGLVAPEYAAYTFSFLGPVDAALEIDGEIILDGSMPDRLQDTIILARGTHNVRLIGTLIDKSARVNLQWSSSGLPYPVAPNFLYNGVQGGLTGEIGSNSVVPLDSTDPSTSSSPYRYQIDPFLGIRDAGSIHASFGARPFFARWRGSLLTPKTGDYYFSVESNGPYVVYIDNRQILSSLSGISSSPAVQLAEGEHSVDIRFSWQGAQGGFFEWFWLTPDGERAIVPPTVLRPMQRMWKPGEVTTPTNRPNLAPPSLPTPGPAGH